MNGIKLTFVWDGETGVPPELTALLAAYRDDGSVTLSVNGTPAHEFRVTGWSRDIVTSKDCTADFTLIRRTPALAVMPL